MTDAESIDLALDEAEAEIRAATQIFGSFNSMHEGYAVLLEEVDELWDEIKAKFRDKARVRAEARQVAAMALRLMVDCT